MLLKNGIDLESIAERAKVDESRVITDINEKNRFVKHADGYFYSSPIPTDFYIGQEQMILAKRGTRPNTMLRYESTDGGATKYLIKFSNKEVWVCDTQINYDLPDRNGVMIGTAEEDLQYVFVAMFGAGGGGSGASMVPATSGTGGAGGGVMFVCVKLEHSATENITTNTFPLYIGRGGNGGYNKNWGDNGESTGFYLNDSFCSFAGGGEGGKKIGERAISLPSMCNGIPFVEKIVSAKGGYGGLKYENGEWKDTVETTPQYGFESEQTQISYFGTVGGNNNGRGGGGGAGPLGNGASERGYNTNGGNGELTAGASGGSYGAVSHTGGKGGSGAIKIYY